VSSDARRESRSLLPAMARSAPPLCALFASSNDRLSRLSAFIKDTLSIKSLLSHIGEEGEALKLFPPRGPPEEWDVVEEFQVEPDSDYQYDETVDR
jgi:hypothetical protein